MNNTELVHELAKIKANIRAMSTNCGYDVQLKKKTLNLVKSVIIDLLDEESSAMQKVDRLAEAIEQAVFISKTNKEPFKVEYINPAKKVAEAINKQADRIRKSYGLTTSKISPEEAEKMVGGTD